MNESGGKGKDKINCNKIQKPFTNAPNSDMNEKNKVCGESLGKNDQSTPTKVLTYFKVSQALYERNHIIKVTFKSGSNIGKSYIYHHDDLYNSTIDHLRSLKCWQNHRAYMSTNNIPQWALNTKLVRNV